MLVMNYIFRKGSTVSCQVRNMLKFAANLTMMFNDAGSLLERYEAAASAGFRYVECASPYSVAVDVLAAKCKELELQQVLINSPVGTGPGAERGLACLPNKQKEFQESIHLSIQYAKALNCKRIHITAGLKPAESNHQQVEDTYLRNLRYASETFAEADITGLIEPINAITIPGYFLSHCEQAVQYLNSLPPNIRLQLDIFHLQMTQGSLTHNITRFLPYTAHVQIAQVPDRHEPFSSGEVQYSYVFDLLRSLKYDGYVGLEYIPAGGTIQGLQWMKQLPAAETNSS